MVVLPSQGRAVKFHFSKSEQNVLPRVQGIQVAVPHPHNNTVKRNGKFWVDQVMVPQPPLGNDKGWGTTRGGGGVSLMVKIQNSGWHKCITRPAVRTFCCPPQKQNVTAGKAPFD